MSEKKYIPQGAFLVCDKGPVPTTLTVTNNVNGTIYGSNWANELDKVPMLNIAPFGGCLITKTPCMPAPILWDPVQDGVVLGAGRLLHEDSKLTCAVGGKIEIHFTMAAAQAAAPPKKKTWKDHVTDFFTWGEENQDAQNAMMRDLLGIEEGSWADTLFSGYEKFQDFNNGLAEGVVKGAGDLVVFAKDVVVWTGKRTPPLSIVYHEENRIEDEKMIKDIAGGVKDLAVWGYRGSALNRVLDPEDWAAAQVENARLAQAAMDHMANMDARDWGNVGGYIAFEVALTAATAGAGQAKNVRHLDKVGDAGRLIENAGDVKNGTKALEEAQDLGAVVNKVDDMSPGSPAHKADRWAKYQKKGGKKNYDEWSNRYDANMKNAKRGNKAADDYQKDIGWGEREVPMRNADGKIERKLDIADVDSKKAVEVKDYTKSNVPASKEILKEVNYDKGLVKDGWDIEWVFKEKGPTKGLKEVLEADPPIKIKIID